MRWGIPCGIGTNRGGSRRALRICEIPVKVAPETLHLGAILKFGQPGTSFRMTLERWDSRLRCYPFRKTAKPAPSKPSMAYIQTH